MPPVMLALLMMPPLNNASPATNAPVRPPEIKPALSVMPPKNVDGVRIYSDASRGRDCARY